jgi:hypothetical protein
VSTLPGWRGATTAQEAGHLRARALARYKLAGRTELRGCRLMATPLQMEQKATSTVGAAANLAGLCA